MSQSGKKSSGKAFSLELLLVIGLPLSAVVAGIVTIVIAVQSGYTQDADARLDRFARPQATETPPS